MPRVVQAGGFSGRMRRRYTLRHSRGILARAQRLQENEGLTLRACSVRLGVSHSLLSKWSRRPALPLHLAGLKKKSVCDGPRIVNSPHTHPIYSIIVRTRRGWMRW
jgi:hypothetical protein